MPDLKEHVSLHELNTIFNIQESEHILLKIEKKQKVEVLSNVKYEP